MKRFRELDSKSQKHLKSYLGEASKIESFDELEEHFISQIQQVIPHDNPCWNNWSTDLTHLMSFRANGHYHAVCGNLFENLTSTLPSHPVLLRGGWDLFNKGACRISDCISEREWLGKNPLYAEAYRHLDVRHQMSYHFVTLSDRALVLTVNRPRLDFSDGEKQKLEVLGHGMAFVTKNLEKNIVMKNRVDILSSRLGELAGLTNPDLLTPKETLALGAIFHAQTISEAARHEGVSNQTFAERLGAIREKLNLHSLPQLRALLRDFSQNQKNT